MSGISNMIRKRDALIHKTRIMMELSLSDAAVISGLNSILIDYGFPERDTHCEPDSYNEEYWWRKAEAMEV